MLTVRSTVPWHMHVSQEVSRLWRQDFTVVLFTLEMYLDNLRAKLTNIAHSSSRDGPVSAWLTSEEPDNVVPVPKNI
jgi:hypothetical protein